MHAVCYRSPPTAATEKNTRTHTGMDYQQGKNCRARLAQRQRLGYLVTVNVNHTYLSLLSILSALNAANPRTQTFSQGPEASCSLQVKQQPEAE